jgi:nicotinamide phosphoribosyltransferase
MRFAFKCASALVNGEWRDVSKDPITDTGKRSKKGHQALVRGLGMDRSLHTVNGPVTNDLLQVVFENGEIKKTYTLDEVRANAAKAGH